MMVDHYVLLFGFVAGGFAVAIGIILAQMIIERWGR